MNALPDSWQIAELRDVTADISYGFTTSSVLAGDGPKLLRITDIQNGSVNWSTVPHCVDTPRAFFLLQAGDIVIARTGATTGKSFLVEKLSCPTAFASYLIRARFGEEIEPKYAWAFMQSEDYWSQIQIVSKGTAQPGANAQLLSKLQFPIAPRSEQRRIVAKIDSLSGKSKRARDRLDHIPRLVEKYKQAILAAAFRGELAENAGAKVDPNSWPRMTVSDVASIVFDGPFGSNLKSDDYSTHGIRVVRLENIGRLRFIEEKKTYVPIKKYEGLKRHTLEPDDVLFSSFIADEIRVCLFPRTLSTIAINKADCFCVRVDRSRCIPKFLEFQLASESTFEQFKDSVHGATRPRISLSQLKLFAIALPTLIEQAQVVRRIEAAFAWIDRLASETTRARKLIDHLDQAVLAKAFRGELVPQDPNDEPASVLLERIRAERSTEPSKKAVTAKRLGPKNTKDRRDSSQ